MLAVALELKLHFWDQDSSDLVATSKDHTVYDRFYQERLAHEAFYGDCTLLVSVQTAALNYCLRTVLFRSYHHNNLEFHEGQKGDIADGESVAVLDFLLKVNQKDAALHTEDDHI